MGLITAIWGTSLRKAITATALTISAVAGAIVAVPPAWSGLGLPEVATRQWAKGEIYRPIKSAQTQTQRQIIDLQLDLATGKLDQLDNARATLEIEKLKTEDPSVKARADQQIRKIDRDSSALSDQVKTLNGLRSADR